MAALYRKIAMSLLKKIHYAELNVGDKLPTESSLMSLYGASRNTVRECLRELEILGYIRRRRGTRAEPCLNRSGPTIQSDKLLAPHNAQCG